MYMVDFTELHNVTEPGVKEKLIRIWQECLTYNLGLVCLTKDKDGKPIIAGMNCTTLCSKYDDESSGDGPQVPVLKTLMWVKKQVDPFSKFNISEYLDAMGLYVPPKFRGEGLGYELLKAR